MYFMFKQLTKIFLWRIVFFFFLDIVYHLEWNESRKFCGGFAEVILHGLCENRPLTEIGKG